MAPLSAMKQLDALKWTSAISIVFVFFIAAVVFFYAMDLPDLDPCRDIDDGDECVGDRVSATVTLDTVRVFGIFIFAYTCQTVWVTGECVYCADTYRYVYLYIYVNV